MTLLTNKRKAEESKIMWELTNNILNNQPVKEKNQKGNEKKKISKQMKTEKQYTKSIGCDKSSSLGEILAINKYKKIKRSQIS